jgi:hypothetical protein
MKTHRIDLKRVSCAGGGFDKPEPANRVHAHADSDGQVAGARSDLQTQASSDGFALGIDRQQIVGWKQQHAQFTVQSVTK